MPESCGWQVAKLRCEPVHTVKTALVHPLTRTAGIPWKVPYGLPSLHLTVCTSPGNIRLPGGWGSRRRGGGGVGGRVPTKVKHSSSLLDLATEAEGASRAEARCTLSSRPLFQKMLGQIKLGVWDPVTAQNQEVCRVSLSKLGAVASQQVVLENRRWGWSPRTAAGPCKPQPRI